MAKTLPYTGRIDRQLAINLLNASGQQTESGQLLGDALIHTSELLAALAEKANVYLEGNEFSLIIADHLARKMNKRGHATIHVTPEGQVRLDVSYEERVKRRKPIPRIRRIPLLVDLRKKAVELGVDISQFGTKRKKIWEYLQGLEGHSGTQVVEDDAGPMSAGFDETRVIPSPTDKLPSKKGFIKTGDPVSPVILDAGTTPPSQGRGKDLRRLVQVAGEVDIQSLLDSDPE